MSETFRAQCNSASGDYVTAEISGDKVELVGHSGDDNVMNAFVTALNARTFARGILALADEIDGGDGKPKIGDRVRVLKTYGAPEFEGATGILNEIDADDPRLPYRVVDAGTGRFIAWANSVVKVDEPEPASVPPLKVGDKLRVTEDEVNDATVRVGDILTVNGVRADGKTFTTDDEVNGGNWYFNTEHVGNGLERVDDSADVEQPADAASIPSSRTALLEKAGELLGGPGFGSTADDLIKLADYLAGE
jgi:hypothetical protein